MMFQRILSPGSLDSTVLRGVTDLAFALRLRLQCTARGNSSKTGHWVRRCAGSQRRSEFINKVPFNWIDKVLYSNSDPSALPTRVGIVVDALDAPAWVQQLVDQIDECNFATIDVALVRTRQENTFPDDGREPSQRATAWARRALYWFYRFLDERFCTGTTNLRRIELGDISVVPIERNLDRSGFSATFREDVESRNLDIILALGSVENASDFATLASQGVLFSSFGEPNESRRGPALLWRIFDRAAKAGTHVRVIHEAPDGTTLAVESYSSTSDSVWLSRHVQAASWRASALYMRFLRSLAVGQELGSIHPRRRAEHLVEAPSNEQMAAFFMRCGTRLVRKKVNMLVGRVQWLLAYRTDASKFVASSGEVDLSGFVPILPEKNHVYADPCVISSGRIDYVFFEDLRQGTARGTIAVIPIEDRAVGPKNQALERDHHLSYPFVFAWEGSMYMLPETSQANSVQLFRATSFPYEWKLQRELLSGLPMVDATLHFHEGSWFLFLNATDTRRGSLNDELFLFFAETPLGPWTPHPKNPVCSDVRRSRPAGRLFTRHGKLIRPSQDCSDRYGARINLCEVEGLSRQNYQEKIVGHIEPGQALPGFNGCHTLSFNERVEVIDVRRTISRFPGAAEKLEGSVRAGASNGEHANVTGPG